MKEENKQHKTKKLNKEEKLLAEIEKAKTLLGERELRIKLGRI